ncbi:MAG: hypothetical protein M1819_000444 [Sarea resinae]|nr:MAG: hypothetical protein M1819_000444 [Sarea resinae]
MAQLAVQGTKMVGETALNIGGAAWQHAQEHPYLAAGGAAANSGLLFTVGPSSLLLIPLRIVGFGAGGVVGGAGIAGPTLAFWLARAGVTTTIVERSDRLRTAGQQIDVRGAALEVIKRMELEDAIRSKTTKEQGLAFVDKYGKTRAEFPVDTTGGRSFVSDIEILRGQLAEIFYNATRKSTRYIFGDYVTKILEDEDGISVKFAKGAEERFDLVVAADGMNSGTRRRIFQTETTLRSLNQYTAYFTIPAVERDGTWAKWYNAPGGRCILLRPDMAGSIRAYLSIMGDAPKGYEKLDVSEQKEMMERLFKDAGWESSRVLEGMHGASDFYLQEIAQVKMHSWSQGRVALLGDAGYCPSPISGMGSSVAIVGAYVLAGELARHQDHRVAFAAYESTMRPYIDKAQNLPPGAPALANPQSAWGISILYGLLSFASKTGLAKWFQGGPSAEQINFPTYDL